MRWVQVTWGQAQFTLGTDAGKVTEVPPIARWAQGQDEHRVAAWFKAKGATFTVVDGPHPPRVVAAGGPEVLWWCETCTGRHTLEGVAACRRGDPVDVPRKPPADGDVRWGPGQKHLEVLRGGQWERLRREPRGPGALG